MFSIPEKKVVPADMSAIKGPVIGYVGALVSLRLDARILEYIAAQRPDWSIVLVGPEDDVFRNSSLHHTANVYFLGTKKPEELPGYINSFDVCLNPQIVNETTIGNYPLKIDEYLAMGKPIVATQTEGMKMFAASVYLAANKEEYVPLIEQALKEDNATIAVKRREVAMSHSWTNMVGNIYREIVEFENSRRRLFIQH